jgi:hypothetical protein
MSEMAGTLKGGLSASRAARVLIDGAHCRVIQATRYRVIKRVKHLGGGDLLDGEGTDALGRREFKGHFLDGGVGWEGNVHLWVYKVAPVRRVKIFYYPGDVYDHYGFILVVYVVSPMFMLTTLQLLFLQNHRFPTSRPTI